MFARLALALISSVFFVAPFLAKGHFQPLQAVESRAALPALNEAGETAQLSAPPGDAPPTSPAGQQTSATGTGKTGASGELGNVPNTAGRDAGTTQSRSAVGQRIGACAYAHRASATDLRRHRKQCRPVGHPSSFTTGVRGFAGFRPAGGFTEKSAPACNFQLSQPLSDPTHGRASLASLNACRERPKAPASLRLFRL